jgi:hypothetical protein
MRSTARRTATRPFLDATATGGALGADVFAATERTAVAATAAAVPTATASRRVIILSVGLDSLDWLFFLMIDMLAGWHSRVKARWRNSSGLEF